MKLLLALTALLNLTTASATSYWFDYCDVTKAAKDFVVSNEHGQTVASKGCTRTAYVFDETAVCLQTITDVSALKYRVTYAVKVKTEQGRVYDLVVKARMGRGLACSVKSVEMIGFNTL